MRCPGQLTISDHAYRRFRERTFFRVSHADAKAALGRYLNGEEMHPAPRNFLVRRKALKAFVSEDHCIVSLMFLNISHLRHETISDLNSILRQLERERMMRNE